MIDHSRTTLAELLPYLEEENLYRIVLIEGGSVYPVGPGLGKAGGCFQNPLDPTKAVDQNSVDYSCSYVSNAQVFSVRRKIDGGIQDGLSQTIFFTEHYRWCRNIEFELFSIHH